MTGGPLAGVRVLELGGIGPAPFTAMALADLGADVARVVRPGQAGDPATGRYDVLNRNRAAVEIDLKSPGGPGAILDLVGTADGFIEGFRPGVCERLGLGPEPCLARNPTLVYGRMTGWGQHGPRAATAGHDITYAAIGGAIGHIGRRDQPPTPPLNLVADFGGGGMLLAVGMLAALVGVRDGGPGQVVDAAMVDGVSLLMGAFIGAHASGFWSDERGTNLLDSGAPFYDCYRCADGGYVAVGAIEPQFFAALLDGLGLDPATVPDQHDRDRWDELRAAIAGALAARTSAEWDDVFRATDACVAPVRSMGELPTDDHLAARRTIVQVDGAPQPAPAPRFSATPTSPVRPAGEVTTVDALRARWSAR